MKERILKSIVVRNSRPRILLMGYFEQICPGFIRAEHLERNRYRIWYWENV